MKISEKMVSSLLALSLAAGNVVAMPETVEQAEKRDFLPHLFEYEKVAFKKTYATLSPTIRSFETIDFDARMEKREFLRLKHKDTFFIETVRKQLLEKKGEKEVEALMMAMEVTALGRPVVTIDPNLSIQQVSQMCGLKRLSALLAFKKDKKNQNIYFLDGKDPFYKSGLSAEFSALEEAGTLFEVSEWLSLKKTILAENEHYDKKYAHLNLKSNVYSSVMIERAQKKLEQEKKLYACRSADGKSIY